MVVPSQGFGRSTVLAAIDAIKAGKIVCVTDDESRENEGDLIMAAEFATPETIGFIVRYTSGVICVSVTLPHVPLTAAANHAPPRFATEWCAVPCAGAGRTAGGAREDRPAHR